MIFARELQGRGQRLSNVVFMGMGEPFHNYDASLAAVRQLMSRSDDRGAAHHNQHSWLGAADPSLCRRAPASASWLLACTKRRTAQRSALMPVNKRWNYRGAFSCLPLLCRADEPIVGSPLNGRQSPAKMTLTKKRSAWDGCCAGLLCHVNIIPLNPTGGYAGIPAAIWSKSKRFSQRALRELWNQQHQSASAAASTSTPAAGN